MDPSIHTNKEKFLDILRDGEITLQGQFVLGFNYTFLVEIGDKDISQKAVYKPDKGQQPIWDFPDYNLSRREVAAYLVSDYLGWDLVPATVLRKTGPLGPGSIQLYVNHDPNHHYFTFNDNTRSSLHSTALFDILINNADRKGGHILLDSLKKIWLIDHGLCFHEEEKIRTVIWDFAGQPIPKNLLADLEQFEQALGTPGTLLKSLSRLINKPEMSSLRYRCQQMIGYPIFPHPPSDRRYLPYPPV